MDHPMNREAVIQNLKDAGCPDDFVENFLNAMERGSAAEQLRLLSCQRCHLLEKVHCEQKKLDCLDFLRYTLKKQADLKASCGRRT